MTWVLVVACAPHPSSTHEGQNRATEPSEPGPPDLSLITLTVGGSAVRPALREATSRYQIGVGELADPVEIVAVPADPRATVVLPDTADVRAGDELSITVSAEGATRTYTVTVLPHGFPELTANVVEDPSPGLTYLGSLGAGFVALVVDAYGVPVWYERNPTIPMDVELSAAGHLTLVQDPLDGSPPFGEIRDATNGKVLRTVRPVPTALGPLEEMDSHEFTEFADGSVLVLATLIEREDLTAWGGPASARVVHHLVQIQAPDGSVSFEWSTENAVDYSTVRQWYPNPKWGEPAALVYAHVNSVALDPEDGNLVVGARYLHQALKVARTETEFRGKLYAPGEVIWRLGGTDSDFTFVGDTRASGWTGFAGQHNVQAMGDRVLVYDNSLDRYMDGDVFDGPLVFTTTGKSRFAEYALDLEAMTATLVAEHPWSKELPTMGSGSVQRLPYGHTLIGWGTVVLDDFGPSVTEIDANGTVVHELTFPDGFYSYRALRFCPIPCE